MQRIQVCCDVCYDETQTYVEAEQTFRLRVSRVPAISALRTLDLCAEHRQAVLGKLAAMLVNTKAADAEAITAAKARGGQVQALPLDVTAEPAAKSANVRPSVKKQWSCPLCGETMQRPSGIGHVWGKHRSEERPQESLTCSECGHKSNGSQGAAAHRRIRHGHDLLAEALKGAS